MKLRKKAAVEQAYLDYSDEVFSFLFWQLQDQQLAEDLTTEVFARAWTSAALRTAQGSDKPLVLYRIAWSALADYQRRGPAHRQAPSVQPPHSQHPSAKHQSSDTQQRVLKALAQLDGQLRAILSLRYMQKVPAASVATIMQLRENDVRVQQVRALKELRKHL